MRKSRTLALTLVAATASAAIVVRAASITGPSSSESPYIVRAVPGVVTTSILTAGDSVGGYRMAGIPDGLGAFDNGDGTFTLLVNHEIPASSSVVRAHGAKGAFVSRWIVASDDLAVLSGEDLIRSVQTWSGSGWTPQTVAFNRFCSASLGPVSAFFNAATGKGYDGRIYLNGEETSTVGRAWAHFMDGTTYELPALGKLAFENAVPHPDAGDATVVIGLDDGPGGQVYVFRGVKQGPGAVTPVAAAGLASGVLYGIKVAGLAVETDATSLAVNTPFTAAPLGPGGDVRGLSGADLESASVGAGVTTFQRPEDGTWDPSRPNDFYFVTTASFAGNSRLWRLRFVDAANPGLGGTITMLLRGNEGQHMLDNLTIDRRGRLILQEDPGGQAHLAKIWAYDTTTGAFAVVAQHDPDRFLPGAPGFLTVDEESSGVIDAGDVLGEGWYLLDVQAHYGAAADVYEGGQLIALHVPPGRKYHDRGRDPRRSRARRCISTPGFASFAPIPPSCTPSGAKLPATAP